MATASVLINGSRAYLHDAIKFQGTLYYEVTYDKDLARVFKNKANATKAQKLIDGKVGAHNALFLSRFR